MMTSMPWLHGTDYCGHALAETSSGAAGRLLHASGALIGASCFVLSQFKHRRWLGCLLAISDHLWGHLSPRADWLAHLVY